MWTREVDTTLQKGLHLLNKCTFVAIKVIDTNVEDLIVHGGR